MNYGYVDKKQIKKQIKMICNCLGGGENAQRLVFETAVAETGIGNIKDTTIGAGIGLTQFDKLPFDDTKIRGMKYRNKIYNGLGIDIDFVNWDDLRYSPFLCLLFTRLFYLLRPGAISSDIEERAKYWKKWYNTKLGKGTVEHYLEMNKKYGDA